MRGRGRGAFVPRSARPVADRGGDPQVRPDGGDVVDVQVVRLGERGAPRPSPRAAAPAPNSVGARYATTRSTSPRRGTPRPASGRPPAGPRRSRARQLGEQGAQVEAARGGARGSRTTAARVSRAAAVVGVLGDRDQRGRGVVQDAAAERGARPPVGDDAQRPAMGAQVVVRVEAAHGEAGVVGQYGAGPGDDRVAAGAQPVDVLARAAGPVIHWLVPSAAADRPSSVAANFQVTWGRPQPGVGQPLGVAALGLGGEQPGLDLDARLGQPPGRRRAASSLGSATAYTTRPYARRPGWPALQGPVRPWWSQGSRVTTTVPPRRARPPARSATISACGPPAKAWNPSPTGFSGGVEHDAADDGVGAGRRRGHARPARSRAHRGSFRRRCGRCGHPGPPSIQAPGVRRDGTTPHTAPLKQGTAARCLPSGL